MGRTTIVTLILLSLAGCGGSDKTDAQPSEPTGSTTSSQTTESASADPGPRQVAMGETIETPRGSHMSVHSFGSASRSAPPPPGTEWTSADVEFCVTESLINETNLTNIRREFELELEDGTVLSPDGSAADPDERFSDDELMVGAGDCERGPVVFAVPRGVAPTTFLLVTPWGNVEWPLDP